MNPAAIATNHLFKFYSENSGEDSIFVAHYVICYLQGSLLGVQRAAGCKHS